jgi:hypothetical protein
VLAAQSARIDGVSGATYTSEAYYLSLQVALDALRMKEPGIGPAIPGNGYTSMRIHARASGISAPDAKISYFLNKWRASRWLHKQPVLCR